MDEPLGYTVGNALEIAEACALLTGRGCIDERFREICLILAARGLVLAGKAPDDGSARTMLEKLLGNGAAARKFAEIIEAQGGDPRIVDEPERLPRAQTVERVRAQEAGFVGAIDAEAIGRLAMEMGAGRVHKEDAIDPAVGIVLMKKTGDPVKRGDVLADLHLSEKAKPPEMDQRLRAAYAIGATEPKSQPVLYGFVD
jgi:thymidine phosphorylase